MNESGDSHGDLHPDEDRLIAHALQELDVRARSEIAAHVETCATCRVTLVTLTAAIDGVRRSPRGGAPAGVLADLFEVQAAARASTARPWWARQPLAVAATIALLLVGSFWAGRRSMEISAARHSELEVGVFSDSVTSSSRTGRPDSVRWIEALPPSAPPTIPFHVIPTLEQT